MTTPGARPTVTAVVDQDWGRNLITDLAVAYHRSEGGTPQQAIEQAQRLAAIYRTESVTDAEWVNRVRAHLEQLTANTGTDRSTK